MVVWKKKKTKKKVRNNKKESSRPGPGTLCSILIPT